MLFVLISTIMKIGCSDIHVWANSAEEQSNQNLHCLQYCLRLFEVLFCGKVPLLEI